MAKNVFVYNLTPRDAAWHSDIVGEGYFEWWYLDGVFEEGYEIGRLRGGWPCGLWGERAHPRRGSA